MSTRVKDHKVIGHISTVSNNPSSPHLSSPKPDTSASLCSCRSTPKATLSPSSTSPPVSPPCRRRTSASSPTAPPSSPLSTRRLEDYAVFNSFESLVSPHLRSSGRRGGRSAAGRWELMMLCDGGPDATEWERMSGVASAEGAWPLVRAEGGSSSMDMLQLVKLLNSKDGGCH